MTGIYRVVVLIALIALALTCYLAGSQTGAVTFFVAGLALCERYPQCY